MALQGVNINLAPYVQDLGYGDTMLAAAMTFRVIIMVIMLPLIGFVAEHTHKGHCRIIPFLIQSAAAILFILASKLVFSLVGRRFTR